MTKIINKIIQYAPFIYGLFIVVFFFALPIVGYELSHFPGDLGDGRFNNYILEHAHQYFTGKVQSFWDAPFMHPEPKVISYSDNLLGSSPFYSVFRLLGFDRETAYQFWFIFIFILNYSCCYLFLKWQIKNKYAAVLGALIFACSMAIQSQITHAQTFPRFPIPLAFWMVMLFFKNLKPTYFFAAILMVVYQLYCAIYLGFFLIVTISLLFLLVIFYKRIKLKKLLSNMKWNLLMLSSIFVNILIILPLMLPYIDRAKSGEMNTYENIIHSIPTLRSFLYSQPGSMLWNKLSNVGSDYPAFWDHQIFAGGFATISLVLFLGIVLMKLINKEKFNFLTVNTSTQILFFTCIVTFLLFTRYQGFSFYTLLFKLPGFAALRSVTRIINVELIFFAFATAYLSNLLFNTLKRWTIPLFLILTGLIVVDNYFKEGTSYRTEKKLAQQRIEKLTKKMKHIPKGSIASYEPKIEEASHLYQIDAMLTGQILGLTMINGYTADSPYGYDLYWREMNVKGREKWLDAKSINLNKVYIIH